MVAVAGGPRRVRGRRHAGVALVSTLVAVLLVGVALALLAASLQLRLRSARQEARAVRLTALADAAVAATLAELAADWNCPGLAEREYAGGTFASRVDWLDLELREVTVHADDGGVGRVVRVRVARTASGLRVSGWRRLPAAAF